MDNMTPALTINQITGIKNHNDGYHTSSSSPEFHTLLHLVSLTKISPPITSKSQRDKVPSICFPVIIIAGVTDHPEEKTMSGFRSFLTEAFHDFSGTIISGGTNAGICGIVGDLQESYPKTITTIGYVPAIIPHPARIDPRYKEIRETDGETFSVKEPLQYWADILASGIPPAKVKLIGFGGGDISAAEYRIALLLGTTVGVLENSGRTADELLKDPEWNTMENLIFLSEDSASLSCFVNSIVPMKK